ncbi:family 16 glycosylhydrolase [Microbulbifer elongatus]|uniref:Family 16 glycosylhydrolase n=1 Tax=Microbulbifer elongatus TaxID=86173 RepID=A0ABT1P4G6_9GAMM|nr:family 16 glycosylhydrolase [Microbulbifer elongatus]MCQ3830997.1 family 16 glycosylhydrolase [Microbulbifer elongatus]
MSKNLTASVALTVTVTAGQQAAAQEIPPPLSDPDNNAGWVINPSVSDEFNGPSFDRDVWFNQGENGQWNGQWRGRAPSEYDPGNVRVENGYLYMTARWDPDHNFSNGNGGGNSQGDWEYGDVPITTAALLGKNTFLYGYMEMRSKAAPGPISSSYWTTGVGGETDAFESFGWNPNNPWSGKRFHTSFHDWRNGSSTYGRRIWENDHIFDFGVADDFHVYGFEWDPNYVAIYIDGALVNCVTREEMGSAWVATNPQRPWIDMETFDWEISAWDLRPEHFNGAEGIDFVVDYSRVYQRTNGQSGGACPNRENLLTNPSFENDLQGWSGPATITTNETSDGNKAASLTSGGTIEQTVAVKPNTSYIVSAWANSADTNQADLWFNAYLGVRDHGKPTANVRYFFNRWHEKSLQFTTGPDTTEATIFFTNKPQGGQVYVDELSLHEIRTTER